MSTNALSALGPILIFLCLVASVAMIALGVRGRPVFVSPRCAKCGYDLRNVQFLNADAAMKCPECGISLSDPDAVSFGAWRTQPRRVVWGVVLLALPGVLTLGWFAVRSRVQPAVVAGRGTAFLSPQQRASQPTATLLARLKTTVSEPWDWQELQARMQRNQLTQAEVDQALMILAADIAARQAKAGGQRQPIHWADQFLTPAVKNGVASPQAIASLMKAFYGVDPKLTMRPTAREAEPIALTLNEYQPWDLPNMRRVWSLTSIVVDGNTTLTPQARYPSGRRGQTPATMPADLLSGASDGDLQLILPHALPPGEHEIVFTREVGVVAQNVVMRGLDGKPGTPEKWPAPFATWTSVVKRKLTVMPRDKSVLKILTDPAQNPFRNASITVEQAVTRASSRGVELVLEFKVNGTLTPLVSYHVYVQAGGEKLDYGTLVAGTDPMRGGFMSGTSVKQFKSIPADLKTVDVLFELDEKAAERFPGIETIWGGPYRINAVKLERYDLGSNPQTQPAGVERR